MKAQAWDMQGRFALKMYMHGCPAKDDQWNHRNGSFHLRTVENGKTL